jgi:NADH:ubiquinone oxidoreductase subunit D
MKPVSAFTIQQETSYAETLYILAYEKLIKKEIQKRGMLFRIFVHGIR